MLGKNIRKGKEHLKIMAQRFSKIVISTNKKVNNYLKKKLTLKNIYEQPETMHQNATSNSRMLSFIKVFIDKLA